MSLNPLFEVVTFKLNIAKYIPLKENYVVVLTFYNF